MAEGIGAAAEGALFARAVEPQRGEAGGRNTSSDDRTAAPCLNCGHEAPGHYCPECGQKTHLHRTLTAIGHDLLHGVLHLDGKLFKTLPLLVTKPGQLTRRYIDGERAHFVSPMAMFLFSVFAMFAVFQVAGIGVPSDVGPVIDEQNVEEIAQARSELEAERATLVELRESSDAPGRRAAINGEISGIEGELQALETVERLAGSRDGGGTLSVEGGETQGNRVSAGSTVSVNAGIDWFDETLGEKWRKNPGLMLYKLQANAYKFSWLLIPLSIPFVWLLFLWKRGFKAYDHAVFVTYSLSFMSLLFLALSIAGLIGVPAAPLAAIGAFAPPIHIYRQLRGTYGIGRLAALWRLIVLAVFILIVTTLFLQALVLLGAL